MGTGQNTARSARRMLDALAQGHRTKLDAELHAAESFVDPEDERQELLRVVAGDLRAKLDQGALDIHYTLLRHLARSGTPPYFKMSTISASSLRI